jgi:predicted ATP-grasp superfamily ATP-dependent carboligase
MNQNLYELLDKNAVLKIGKHAGFCVPKSQYLSEPLGFDGPYIMKAVRSTVFDKAEYIVCETSQQLETLRAGVLAKYVDAVVQQYIDGSSQEEFEVHTYNSSGGPIIAGMLQRTLSSKGPTEGQGLLLESTWVEEFVQPSNRLTELSGFKGALDINLKRSVKEGITYFLEVNYRTSSNLMLDTKAGLNVPAVIYCDCNNIDIGRLVSRERRKGVKWVNEARLIRGCRGGLKMPLMEFVSEAKYLGACAYFDRTDVRPFIGLGGEIVKSVLTRFIKAW